MKREIGTSAARAWVLWLGIVAIASAGRAEEPDPTALGETPGLEDPSQATKSSGGEGPAAGATADSSRPLTPGEQAALIQKPRIAEETFARLQGLREAGNPHIRKGLKIGNLQDHPERSQVDLEKLRADAIARIENREGFHRPVPVESGEEIAKAHNHGESEEVSGPSSAAVGDPATDPTFWSLTLILLTGGLSLAGVWWASRK